MKGVIIILLLAAVFIVGYMQSGQKPIPAAGNNESLETINTAVLDCSAIADVGKRDVCLIDVLANKKDVEVCNQFSDIDLKIKCYANVAGATQNPNICVKLTVDAWRDSCYYSAAVSKQDPIICFGIIFDEMRRDCYEKINTSELNERETCSQLWTEGQKEECRSMFSLAK